MFVLLSKNADVVMPPPFASDYDNFVRVLVRFTKANE